MWKKRLLVIVALLLAISPVAVKSLEPQAGFGRCSLCPCRRYVGSGVVCYNCGHNYRYHW